jgi:HTH-type transcriptional regulator, transcriptional repressor of NAD biosynthesis genes
LEAGMRGVVIGKFDPFHRGHKQLIETALAYAGLVTVIVCEKATDSVPAELRREWIARTHPDAEVVMLDQDALGLADDDTQGWAVATVRLLGGVPDLVFTGEDYGDAWAAAMGARHVRVPRSLPVSGTLVRGDPLAHMDMLEPIVRAHYVKRVCILGAESTGKTTLAADLAQRYATLWVPEYGRIYTEVGRRPDAPWTSGEFEHIAHVHRWYEDFLAAYANRVLFCDTDAFVTARFHEAYLGAPTPDDLAALATEHRYDLFILCDVATPFVQDGWRLEHARGEMHTAYRNRLEGGDVPWLEVHGSRSERVDQAARAVDGLLGPAAASLGLGTY